MASKTQLLLLAKARRRRAEAEAAGGEQPAETPVAGAQTVDPGLAVPGTFTPGEDAYVQPTLIDQIMGGLQSAGGVGEQTVYGGATGIENVFGLPGDIVDALGIGPSAPMVGMLPSSEELGSLFGREDRPDPEGWMETLANRIGEEVGASAVPIGGLAAKGVNMGVKAAREGGVLSRMFLEPAAVNPTKFIANEGAYATAAGTGAGVANMMVDRDTAQGQVADLIGALSGAGLLGLGDVIAKGAGGVLSAVFQKPNYIDDTVKAGAVDRVAKAAGVEGSGMAGSAYDVDPLVAQIMDALPNQRPSEVVPGFKESLADRTGNPGLAALEYSRQSGPNAGEFAKRRSDNAQAVDQTMRSVEPQETPGTFRSELDATREARLAAAAQGTGDAQSEFERYIQNLSPTMNAEDRGSTVRAGVVNAERAARESESAIWQGIEGEVDPAPLADTLDQTRADLTEARRQRVADMDQTVDIPRQLSGTPEEPAGPVNIQEMNDMRSTLLQEQRKAQSGPQADRNRAQALGELIADINRYMDSDAVPARVRQQTATARGVSVDVNERFNRPNDPLASVLSTKEGRPDVPDSAVAGKFIQPDSRQASNIDRLLAETDLSSHAVPVRDALKDEILTGVERSIGDPARLEQYLDQFSRVFERFPDLREEIRLAAGAGRRVTEAGAAEGALQADVGTPDGTVKGRGPVGKYLSFSDATSDRAMAEVLASKDPGAAVDELLNFIGDNPRAVEGARAAFWQKMRAESQSVDNAQRSMSGARAWRGDWLKSFLDKPATRAVVERLYRDAPEQLARIRQVADVLDNVDLRQRGKATGTSGTAQGVNPVLTPETLQSRFYAYMRGAVGGTYLVTSIAAVLARRAVRNAQTAALDRLTDQMLLDPELAAAILRENNPANRAALRRKAKIWFGNEASTIVNLLDPEEDRPKAKEPAAEPTEEADDDDLVDAVMR